MGAERFFQLFDWNSKSKKKLFPSKLGFPDEPKHGKRSNRNLPAARYEQTDDSSVKGSSEHSCASSVVDDGGYDGVQAPSVVARLMGLNSLPTHNCSEPSSTPFFDSQSLRSSHNQREHVGIEQENQMYHSGGLIGQSKPTYNSKPHKVPSRPLEKFQSEVLPPRSAKSIPITQHKLLSPIKSSGMFFSGDAAHIMEAAAKIIESGSQAVGRNRMPLVGPSMVPLKFKDFKEKPKVTQERPDMGFSFASLRSKRERVHAYRDKISSTHSSMSFRMRDKEKTGAFKEKTSVGYSSGSFRIKDRSNGIQDKTSAAYTSTFFRMKEKEAVDIADERFETGSNSGSFRAKDKERPEGPMKASRPASVSKQPFESNAAKSLGFRDTFPFTAPSKADVISISSKGKSVSLAIQAKVNVQKREGMRVNTLSKKEQQPDIKSQPSHIVKNIHKRSPTPNAFSVLGQNQQQNSATNREMSLRPSNSNSGSKTMLFEDSYSSQYKSYINPRENLKTRKLSTNSTNWETDQVHSVKNVPRKKRNIDSGILFEANQTLHNGMNNNKSLKSGASVDQYAWIEDSRKKGMDVVSFTFTSPMTRPTAGFNSSSQMAQITDDSLQNNRGKKLVNGSGHKLNVIGSDALSLLLEQKLRELTTSIRPSSSVDVKLGALPNFESNILCQDASSVTSKLNEHPGGQHTKRFCSRFDSGLQVYFPVGPKKIKYIQEVDEMDALSSNHGEAKNTQDTHLPSPVSILEGSFSTESCNSSRTIGSGFEDSMHCSSVQAYEVLGTCPPKRFHHIEADLSDSASSISPATVIGNDTSKLSLTNTSQSATKWELNYVKDILSNVDIMFENFSVGKTPELLDPQLFEDLEISKGWERNNSKSSRLDRKLYFNCVSESLDLKCKQYVGGGCKAWCSGMVKIVKCKERLAKELCKDISGLACLSDCMVDELVDKDMSGQHGKWLNFEVEEFSLGVDVEVRIFNSLVDEMVADFLWH